MKKKLRLVVMGMVVCSLLAGCTTLGSSSKATGSEYYPGTRTKTDYTSEWLGLKYTLNSDMVMASDDEINNIMKIGTDLLFEDTETGKMVFDYAQIATVYDMLAINVINNSNISIVAEKLLISGITDEQYFEATKALVEQMDMTVTYNDITTRTIHGIEFAELSYAMEVNGVAMKQMFLVEKLDDRMAIIGLTYFDQATLDALLAGFSAY